eukprot:2351108-Rhodomonas_salina.2
MTASSGSCQVLWPERGSRALFQRDLWLLMSAPLQPCRVFHRPHGPDQRCAGQREWHAFAPHMVLTKALIWLSDTSSSHMVCWWVDDPWRGSRGGWRVWERAERDKCLLMFKRCVGERDQVAARASQWSMSLDSIMPAPEAGAGANNPKLRGALASMWLMGHDDDDDDEGG